MHLFLSATIQDEKNVLKALVYAVTYTDQSCFEERICHLVITKEDTILEQHLLGKARHSKTVPSTGNIVHYQK